MLVPDCSTAVLDPFAAQTSLIIFCDVHEPLTGQPYARDPRSTAKKAEQYLISTGIGDTAYFGPEAEFFIFDDVRYRVDDERGDATRSTARKAPTSAAKKFPDGNTGHRPPIKGGYFPVPPVDGQADLRAEMLSVMADMGLKVEKHHHEVAPSQAELGFDFSTLVNTADNMQIYKYVVHNVAHQYGKTATFMPKPIKGDNGSGMHAHQSIWKGEQAALRRQPLCRSLRDRALLHRRHHQARQGDQRLHQPDDQQLQAADPRLRGAGAARLFVAQPLGLVPHPVSSRARRPSASRCASPTPPPTPISALPRC